MVPCPLNVIANEHECVLFDVVFANNFYSKINLAARYAKLKKAL